MLVVGFSFFLKRPNVKVLARLESAVDLKDDISVHTHTHTHTHARA